MAQKTAKRPGAFSRWMQHTMNARTNKRIRKGRGTFMGMDLLILHTEGHRSGQPRQTPLARFTDGEDSWLVVASGGGELDPDWFVNLMTNPDRTRIELPGDGAVPATPHRLDGAERDEAWGRIAAAQPRIAKYQSKTDRQYPVVRLTPR